MQFEFDERKSRANKAKHGIDSAVAQVVWLDESLIELPARTTEEPRSLVVGVIAAAVCDVLSRNGWDTAATGCRPYDESMPWASCASLLECTPDESNRHMPVNARATLLLSAEFAWRFGGPAGGGRIVNLLSGPPLTGEIACAAGKGTSKRIHLTRRGAGELIAKGITVNAVSQLMRGAFGVASQ